MNEAREKAWEAYWSTDEAGFRVDEPQFNFNAGWDTARTFTNEDVERAEAAALRVWHEKAAPRSMARALVRRSVRAALRAVGTVADA